MDDAASLRDKAARCRRLAETADERTAATLRMLADDYEAEARALEPEAKPPSPAS
jgi:hypothetical protein